MNRQHTLVFISNIPSPYMVKLCYALNKYLNTHFLFYTTVEKGGRPSWWNIPLGDKCQVVNNNIFAWHQKFLNIKMLKILINLKPDIVILGGFTIPTNFLCYLYCRVHKIRAYIFSEYLRFQDGTPKKLFFIKYLYKNIGSIFAAGDHAKDFFIKNGFNSNKVYNVNYPMDIDSNFNHPFRTKCSTIIFPHRLIPQFNPKAAIKIVATIKNNFPDIKLYMNTQGVLKSECEEYIHKLQLDNNIVFIDQIDNWNELPSVYKKCDVCISPLLHSNGAGSIIEAMASGMGIIISDTILVNKDMITNGINGFKYPPEDTQSFSEAIIFYINNPDELKKHAIINRKLVKKYSVEMTAQLYANILTKYDASTSKQ